MSTAPSDVRYASAEDVLLALDKDPDDIETSDKLWTRAEKKATAATQKWINQTSRPFHPVQVGDPDESRTWETHDVHDAETWDPVRVMLDNRRILPLDPDEGDTLEVRTSRDNWEDITSEEGDEWVIDYRTRRLLLYRRRLDLVPFDDPNTRFVRICYRYGPLGEDVTITDDVVETVPADVTEAVAAKAASALVLDDELKRSMSNDGQLTDRSTKRAAFKETWDSTTAEYGNFSSL